MFGFQVGQGRGLIEFLDRIRSDDGLLVLLLITLLLFICYLALQLLWKVCHTVMEGKDQEIVRLTKELDRYQSVVFERLLVSDDDLALFTDKGWPEDESGGGNSSQDKVH
jgi:hypothetical protein